MGFGYRLNQQRLIQCAVDSKAKYSVVVWLNCCCPDRLGTQLVWSRSIPQMVELQLLWTLRSNHCVVAVGHRPNENACC